jgi:hypothetical protein
MDKKREGGEREEKKKNKEKKKIRKGKFRHFTTSIQQVKPFCQTFSKTASAPSIKPLHQMSQSRSRSPAKRVRNIINQLTVLYDG